MTEQEQTIQTPIDQLISDNGTAVLAEATALLGGTASVEEMIAKDIAAGKTAPRLTPQFIMDQIRETAFYVFPGTTVTVCCLTLLNGYNVTGTSACISPSNFNLEIGMNVAKENAIKEIWALEGYLMKEMLHTSSLVETTADRIKRSDELCGNDSDA